MNTNPKKEYLTPKITIAEFEVELGFAASAEPEPAKRSFMFFGSSMDDEGMNTGANFDRELNQGDWLN